MMHDGAVRKHGLAIAARFEWALALTYAVPAARLLPLVAPGLRLDELRGHGFLAVACVRTRRLRPAALPAWLGLDFFLAGYRVFVVREHEGKRRRGLQALASETDRWLMAALGARLTHYGYRRVRAEVERSLGIIAVRTSSGLAIRVSSGGAALPSGSFFTDREEARRYAGPMPNTFASEDRGATVVRIESERVHWKPMAMTVDEARVPCFAGLVDPGAVPDSAFLVEDVAYRWKRGAREPA